MDFPLAARMPGGDMPEAGDGLPLESVDMLQEPASSLGVGVSPQGFELSLPQGHFVQLFAIRLLNSQPKVFFICKRGCAMVLEEDELRIFKIKREDCFTGICSIGQFIRLRSP